MSTQDSPDDAVKIEYRPDGKIPIGIWIVWGAFAVWAIYYSFKYAVPDLLLWLKNS